VIIDRVNGSVMGMRCDQLDNKSGKSSSVENVPDKSENLTEVSYLSNKNVVDNISSDAE